METLKKTNKISFALSIKRAIAIVLLAVIRCYQCCISPWLAPHCRFQPSCSQYAITAIKMHGPGKGLWLSVRRIAKCHPWQQGGDDPVPTKSNSDRNSGL